MEKWKAHQRDWLMAELRKLLAQWEAESTSESTVFMPDERGDAISKARTGGCAVQLKQLLALVE